MKRTLQLAAVYNLLWGVWAVLFPNHFFALVGMEPLNHPMVWQGMGMVIGLYGLGYWWASYDPVRHWPIVAVGFLGKLFGPIGFFFNYLRGLVPFEFIYTLITNDFIWWIPFFLILKKVHTQHHWQLRDTKMTWFLSSFGYPVSLDNCYSSRRSKIKINENSVYLRPIDH